MALIAINDTATVKKMADNILSQASNMQNIYEQIESILQEIKQYWNESQEDEQYFATILKNSNDKHIKEMSSCNYSFAYGLSEYIAATERISGATYQNK